MLIYVRRYTDMSMGERICLSLFHFYSVLAQELFFIILIAGKLPLQYPYRQFIALNYVMSVFLLVVLHISNLNIKVLIFEFICILSFYY